MSANRTLGSCLAMAALVLGASFVLPGTAAAAACASPREGYSEMARLRDEIAAAESLEQARALALAPTQAAFDALQNARTVAPFSDDLRLAEARLADARSRLEAAGTPRQVADEFAGMMVAGLDDSRTAQIRLGKVGCDYSTGEVIAIVLGLLLGVIPGLILLFLLC